jgi:hypothetical protein
MSTSSAAGLNSLVEHWVATGIITAEQAERIRTDEATVAARSRAGRPTSLVIEAMAYLGGVIILVGLGLVIGWFWEDLSTDAHLMLTGAVTILLIAAGAVVPRGLAAVGVRLRSVLWAMASSAVFAFLALLAADRLDWDGNEELLLAGAGTAIVSAVLWAIHQRMLQQASVLLAVLLAAGAATALYLDPLSPLAVVWGVGVVWCGLAWLRLVRPYRTGLVLGTAAAIVGSLAVEYETANTVMSLVTVVAAVALAVAIRDLILLGVASIGTLIVLPNVVVRYFPGVLSAALALMAAGVVLVAAAVFTARRRRPKAA